MEMTAGSGRMHRTGRRAARTAAVAVAVGALALIGCGVDKPSAPATVGPTRGAMDYFPIKIGDKPVRLQLAVRQHEMQRGLMDRRDLGPDDGMIFVYEKPQQMHFWMRNTPTPLDIGFFARDGTLEEIHPLHPFDERSVSSRTEQLCFAVEVNQGWFRANGIKPGARLDLKALAEALKSRGFEPRRYGLE